MASSGALSRFVATPAAPAPSATQSVASFTSQKLGGLISGQSSEANQAVRGGLSTPNQVAAPLSGNAVQASAQTRMRSIQESNSRMAGYAALKQQRQAQAPAPSQQPQAASGRPSVAGSVQSTGVGRAYTPQGGLSAARNKVIQTASKYIGTQYVLGGTTTKGIDCSGLLMMVYNQFGYKLPHHSGIQSRTIPGVRTNINNLRPGDIIAWKDGSHIGIYAGNGYIIDAANRQIDTSKRKINMGRQDVYGIRLKLPGE